MANVLICKNPFRPQLDRETVPVRAGTRLDTVLRKQALVSGRASKLVRNEVFVVQVNGEYLLQAQWARRIGNEDVVVVMLLPGDGGGGSNPLRMVLQVALIVAAVYTGGLATAAWGATAGALTSAGIMIAGGLLINALLPPPKASSMQAREQASPTYTISAQGNTARLMEAIPVLYGRFLTYPDFASHPYTEIDSNQVYLYQLFCISQGEIDIEQIRIEDTPIDNFAEVQYQVVPPGGRVTLFPDNVVTSSAVQGLELLGPNEAGGGYVGPFVANPAGSLTDRLAVDIVFPQGLFYANDDGGLSAVSVSWTIQARQIDDDGNAVGTWATLGNESYSNATATPQMRTYRYSVAEGRYEVRAIRTSNKHTESRYANTLQWGGLRAYLPSQKSYGNVTMLAVAMRATNNLNQSTSRRINVVATRKLKTWNPVDGWSTSAVATRSPAWAFADVLSNSIYGKGMLDSRINLNEIYRLAGVWEARGDTFDGVFDTTVTLWEALTRIARVGRAMPMYYAGVVDIVRNEPRTVKKAMFTPMNIVADTFAIDYKFVEHDSPDHVVVEIINEDTWQPDEVKCVLPGGTELRPARVQLPGCVKRDQAWREGISMAAANRDQRRFVDFTTELEGHIPKYSDLVGISHDVPKWGLSGFVRSYNPATRVITTSELLEWWPGENHYIALRGRDGSVNGPYRVTKGAGDYEAIAVSAVSAYVSTGDTEEPTYYQFGPGERRHGLEAQVLSASPDESGRVALSFVNYADSVHTAELGGEVPPPPPPSLLPITPNAPVVDEVTVYATSVAGEQIASCTPARGAQVYEFQASNDLGATWTPLGSDTTPSIRIRLPAGPWWVRARGVGVMPGPWKIWQGVISATMLPPPALTSLIATGQVFGIKLTWSWPSAISLKYIEIYQSETPNFNDSTLTGRFPYPQSSHVLSGLLAGKVFYFWARLRDEADQPGPWFGGETGVMGQSSADADEILSYLENQIDIEHLTQWLKDQINAVPGLIDDMNELGQQVAELMGGQEWDEDTDYLAGTVVFDDGKMYRALQNVPAGTPTSNATYWKYIGDYSSLGDAVSGLAISVSEIQTQVTEIDGQVTVIAGQTSTMVAQLREDDGEGRLEDVLNEHESRAWIARTEKAVATNERAQATINTQLVSQMGQNQAAIQETYDTLTTLDGSIAANWSIKTQIVGGSGEPVVAGLNLGVKQEPGQPTTSHFTVAADVFRIINLINGVTTIPFTVVGGQVLLRQALIGTGWIQTAHIENAAVTTAKIANAQITTAKIGSAQVDTLRIAGNAVTIHGAAESGPSSGPSPYVRDLNVTISVPYAAQATVVVHVGMSGGSSGYADLRLNGNQVKVLPIWIYANEAVLGNSSAHIINVGPGTHTFGLRQSSTNPVGGNAGVPEGSIVVLVAMR